MVMVWIFFLSGFIINNVKVVPAGETHRIILPGDYAYFIITGDFNDTLFYKIHSSYIHPDVDSIKPVAGSLKFYGKIDEDAPMLIHFSIDDENISIKDSLYLTPDIKSALINKHIFNPQDTLMLDILFSWNGEKITYGITSAYLIIKDSNNAIIDSVMMEKGDSMFFVNWNVPAIKGDFNIDLSVSSPNAHTTFEKIKGFTTISAQNSPMLFVFDAPNTPEFTARLGWYKDVFKKEFNDYFLWNVWYRGLPDTMLFSYNFVIWYESSQGGFVLSRRQKELFVKYVNTGGKCILIAPYIGRYVVENGSTFDSTFLNNTLHIKFIRAFNEKGYLSRIEFLPENTEISHWIFTLYNNIKLSPMYGEEVDTVFPAKPLFSYEGGKFAGIYTDTLYSLALLDFCPEEILSEKGEDIFLVIKALFEDSLEIKNISMLSQNYPNPFSNYTIIPYTLKENGFIELKICDLAGRVVKEIDKGFREKGEYTSSWDGKNKSGKEVKAGLYFYHLIVHSGAKTFHQAKKMLKLK